MKYHTVIVVAHEENQEPCRFTFNNMTAEEAEATARRDFQLEFESEAYREDDDVPPDVYLDYIFASDSPIEVLVE